MFPTAMYSKYCSTHRAQAPISAHSFTLPRSMERATKNTPYSIFSTDGAGTKLIMDNLIAEGKIDPFIIVMTYGLTNNIKFGTIDKFDAKEFEKLLIDELIPYIDANFNTIPDKDHRAMAGLSMGGVETKLITTRRPEVFGYYGLLSGGTYAPEDLKDSGVKLAFISCGSRENPEAKLFQL